MAEPGRIFPGFKSGAAEILISDRLLFDLIFHGWGNGLEIRRSKYDMPWVGQGRYRPRPEHTSHLACQRSCLLRNQL